VVEPWPSEKYESVGVMNFPTEWKNKSHVPNHQQDGNFCRFKVGLPPNHTKHDHVSMKPMVTTGDPHLKKLPFSHVKFNQITNKNQM
jgi:hypothetical protein